MTRRFAQAHPERERGWTWGNRQQKWGLALQEGRPHSLPSSRKAVEAASARPQLGAGEGGEGSRGARRGGKQAGRQACGQEWEEETRWGEVAGCRHGTQAWPLGNTSSPPSKLGWVTPTGSLLALGLPPPLSDEGVPLWMRWPVRPPASGVLASC